MLVVDFDKDSARIYRRKEMRQPDGSYKRPDERLGTLPLTATSLPPDFPPSPHEPLTEKERAALQTKFFDRAKVILQQRRIQEEERLVDPIRRIASARELLKEATLLSKERPVAAAELSDLLKQVLAVQSADGLFQIEAVRQAALAAAVAADSGVFGTRSEDEPLKSSLVTARWNDVRAAVVGAEDSSLMRSLQRKKWVKVKED